MLIKKPTADKYLKLLSVKGERGLYKHIIGSGIILSVNVKNPDIELLDISEGFFRLYRRAGDENKEAYFTIGKVLRRAAHTLYRQFLHINQEKATNTRFLNVV